MNTTANKITLLRILLVPVFLILEYTEHTVAAFVVYVLASLSDLADGYIARHYHQITVIGKFMDPLADKMLVLSAMCILIEKGTMPAWAVAAVIFREFAVSGLRLIAAQKNIVIAAAQSGKIKTACTMVCLALMLFFLDRQLPLLNGICTALILVTTLYSGFEYFKNNIQVFKETE